MRRTLSAAGALGRATRRPRMLLLVVAGGVAVAYLALGVSLLQQRLNQDLLSSQIYSAEAVLATADEVRGDLEAVPARLEAAKRELAAAQVAFPTELDSNHILETILALADESGVRVLSVSTLAPAGEPAADAGLVTVLSFAIEAEGEFDQVIAFLAALDDEGASATTRTSTFVLRPVEGRHALSLELLAYARSPSANASSPERESSSIGETGAADGSDGAPRR